jgi:hypothetical protein
VKPVLKAIWETLVQLAQLVQLAPKDILVQQVLKVQSAQLEQPGQLAKLVPKVLKVLKVPRVKPE